MERADKKPLIILTGATGVGKTALSLSLAERIGAEILSADSMQVYRGMDIGTAKIRPEETKGIPHHLIDVLDPKEEFNVVRFQKMATDVMTELYAKGKIPLMVGGTGFYIQSVLYGIDFSETDDDPSIRNRYEETVRTGGDEAKRALHERLREIDPASAETIPEGNVKRVIRALEFFEKTGLPISEHNKRERAKTSPYAFRYFVLTDDRQTLYDTVNARVERMMEEGLLAEVTRLKEQGVPQDATSMQGLGYRELYAYLDGVYDLDRAVALIKQNTRHFVKRQLTWFHREKDAIFLDKRDFQHDDARILEEILKQSAAVLTNR